MEPDLSMKVEFLEISAQQADTLGKKRIVDVGLKGVFAKNERGYRRTAQNNCVFNNFLLIEIEVRLVAIKSAYFSRTPISLFIFREHSL